MAYSGQRPGPTASTRAAIVVPSLQSEVKFLTSLSESCSYTGKLAEHYAAKTRSLNQETRRHGRNAGRSVVTSMQPS